MKNPANEASSLSFPPEAQASVVVENVYPEVDCGRYPVKREVGQSFEVWADVFKPGHDSLAVEIIHRREGAGEWKRVPAKHFDNDRWFGRFTLDAIGRHQYTIEAWTDWYSTLLSGLERWLKAGEDSTSDLEDTRRLVDDARKNAGAEDEVRISRFLSLLDEAKNASGFFAIASDMELRNLVARNARKRDLIRYKTLEVVVDRNEASFASWYEMFHRSQGRVEGRSGTFKDCEARLPEIRKLGFDVVYLPPIHPVGRTNRRGRGNLGLAKAGEPGSPWAVGSSEGGHTSVNRELGTMEDFEHFVRTAREAGIEVALDLSLQCSPDHPYVKEHPEWFNRRSDGSIRYAENPPKRYYDIYPLNFACSDWKELWEEMKKVVLFWVGKGIRSFRVDNPHTKPPRFWEWLIGGVKKEHPDVLFLSEAFTRPKVMKNLAKLGFSQSYTYFTWKNTKRELEEFAEEFLVSDATEYYRGNLFTNTPDILSEFLQKGGRTAFKTRLVLAATLSSVYGIYNGFELCESRARAEGSEEYLDSEKYQYKVWDWDRPGNIKDFIQKVNKIRRENQALQQRRNLRLLTASNESIISYGRWTEDGQNVILVAVNLDPSSARDSLVTVPVDEIGIGKGESYMVHDLITDEKYRWTGESNYVKLDPAKEPAHILRVER